MSEIRGEEPLEPKSAHKSAQPMPRLWKSEPEPTEDDSPPARKSKGDGRTEPSKKSSDSKASTQRKDEVSQGEGIGRRG